MRLLLSMIMRIIRNHKFALAVIVIGLFLNFWYIFMHPLSVLYGGPGDHTAGLIWLYEQSPQTPWWTFSHASAYPFGDSLWNPAYILGQTFYIFYWVCATVMHSGVGGYNLLVIIYLVLSYLIVYCVILKLTRVSSITAAVVSYIAAFCPFLLFLSGVGHASYMLAPAWAGGLFYCLYKVFEGGPTPKRRRYYIGSVMLLGLSWLHDPYFVLFSYVLFLGEFFGFIILFKKKQLLIRARRCIIILVTSLLLFIPVGVYSLTNASSLVKNTYDVRSDIRVDAEQYSARVKDFFLPSRNNPLIPSSIREYKAHTYHGLDPTFTTYIGWSTIAIILLALAGTLMKKIKWISSEKRLVVICVATMLIILVFAMPPYVYIGSLKITTLTYVLTALTGIWRVLARIYIFFLPIYLIVVALCLDKVLALVARIKIRTALSVVALLLFIIDFLPRAPFDTSMYWNIEHSLPSSYEVIKKDPSIKVIAEYPLREAPHYRGSLYFTAQLFHKKKLINSTQAVTDQTLLREALMDLDNPQTIRTLRLLGTDTINVWQNGTQQWAGNKEVTKISEVHYSSMFGNNDKVSVFRLNKQNTLDPLARYVATLDVDSRMTNGEYLHDVLQTIPRHFNVRIVDICHFIEVRPRCGGYPNISKAVYKSELKNESSQLKFVSIQYKDKKNSLAIPPGDTVHIVVPLDSFKDPISINLSDSYKMNIVGGHLE